MCIDVQLFYQVIVLHENRGLTNRVRSFSALMKEAGKTYRYEIYTGAGNAYMRRGAEPEGSEENKKARENSCERMLKILESR
ncbi:MAG: hypothetical protein KGY60_03285 [Bacteroidales bacterium]|nr:hypothetical protein [Bacteroidales bacterium]